MNYKNFKKNIIEAIEEKLENGEELMVNTVVKNNNQALDGLTIKTVFDDNVPMPTVYIQHLYDMSKRGGIIDEIVDIALTTLRQRSGMEKKIVECVETPEVIMKNTCCKLLNTEKNSEYLKDVPVIPFLDLSIVFYVIVDMDHDGILSYLVNKSIFDEIKMSPEELLPIALENTARLLGKNAFQMENVFNNMGMNGTACASECMADIYVLTNDGGRYGAIYMLDRDALRAYAIEHESNVVIIPSSVHEVMIVPESCVRKEFADMLVKKVNEEELEEADFLSDHAYVYSLETGEITM